MVLKRKNIRSGFHHTDDDVQIHWRTIGDGPPLICSNGVGVSTFFWQYIAAFFEDRYTIVFWDYRGHGLSQRQLNPLTTDLSIERHVTDLLGVLGDIYGAKLPDLTLLGPWGAGSVLKPRDGALKSSDDLPLGTAGRALESFANNKYSPTVFNRLRRLSLKMRRPLNRISRPLLLSPLAWPFTSRLSLVDPLYTAQEDFAPYLNHMASMDIAIFLQTAWQCHLHDAWDYLYEIDIPVLIFAGERDAFTPLHCAKQMADRIPISRLYILADGSHAALIEQPENINHQLDHFFETFPLQL